MAREIHSDDTPIEQPRNLVDLGDLVAALKGREPEIVEADPELTQEYLDEIAFMNEWVTVRIDPSGSENEPNTTQLIATNGRYAEVLINGQAVPWGYLPIGPEITIRRHSVEALARSKTMKVRTNHEMGGPDQQVVATTLLPQRRVSQTQPFSILNDPSPRGRAWLSEMIRRQF